MENASPLEIMDTALEKFGNDIASAFRSVSIEIISMCKVSIFTLEFIV